ncbi:MAG: hypothetical protein CMD49_04270 [Gammaproteobacteria bacterium]|nr:hypothetical protein [Gammaproteobacteria bacterium]
MPTSAPAEADAISNVLLELPRTVVEVQADEVQSSTFETVVLYELGVALAAYDEPEKIMLKNSIKICSL